MNCYWSTPASIIQGEAGQVGWVNKHFLTVLLFLSHKNVLGGMLGIKAKDCICDRNMRIEQTNMQVNCIFMMRLTYIFEWYLFFCR